jgi:hypothetical protein
MARAMSPNPLPERHVPHNEAVRRFLKGLNGGAQPPRREPKGWLTTTEPMVSLEAAEELARWFAK